MLTKYFRYQFLRVSLTKHGPETVTISPQVSQPCLPLLQNHARYYHARYLFRCSHCKKFAKLAGKLWQFRDHVLSVKLAWKLWQFCDHVLSVKLGIGRKSESQRRRNFCPVLIFYFLRNLFHFVLKFSWVSFTTTLFPGLFLQPFPSDLFSLWPHCYISNCTTPIWRPPKDNSSILRVRYLVAQVNESGWPNYWCSHGLSHEAL